MLFFIFLWLVNIMYKFLQPTKHYQTLTRSKFTTSSARRASMVETNRLATVSMRGFISRHLISTVISTAPSVTLISSRTMTTALSQTVAARTSRASIHSSAMTTSSQVDSLATALLFDPQILNFAPTLGLLHFV